MSVYQNSLMDMAAVRHLYFLPALNLSPEYEGIIALIF